MPIASNHRSLVWIAIVLSLGLVSYQGWDMVVKGGEPILQGHDDTGYFLWLNSWALDGDNDLANNLANLSTLSEDIREEWLNRVHPSSGKVLDKYPVGWAVLNWPVYKVTYLIHRQFSEDITGTEPIYFAVIWSFQWVIAFVSLLISLKILRRYFASEAAQWALLVTWLASPLLYYQTARLGLAHNQAYFLTVLLIWLSLELKEKNTRIHWFAIGLSSGLLLITRLTSICYLLIPAWFCWLQLKSGKLSDFKKPALAALAGAIPILFQMSVWNDTYGSPVVFSYTGETFSFLTPALFGALFSDRHGLFNWHPLLFIGAGGWLIGTFRAKIFPKVWTVSFAAIVYLNSAWWCWWFGSSFGNRAYEGSMLFFMAGLGFCYDRFQKTPWKLTALKATAWIAIFWNIYLLSEYLTNRFDRGLPVSFIERLTAWF